MDEEIVNQQQAANTEVKTTTEEEGKTTVTETTEVEGKSSEGAENTGEGEDKDDGDKSAESAKEALRLLEENKKLKPFANLGYVAAKLAQKNDSVREALEKITDIANSGGDIDEAIENLGKEVKKAASEETTDDKKTAPPVQMSEAEDRELRYAAQKVAESYPQIMTGDEKAKDVARKAFEIYYTSKVSMQEAWNGAAKEIYGNPLSVEDSKFKQELSSGFVAGGTSSVSKGDSKTSLAAKNVNKANPKISEEEAKKLFSEGVLDMEDYLD